MFVLDTDIMIDLLCQFPPATAWLASCGAVPLALPGFVAMELIQGCRNKDEQRKLTQMFDRFHLVWPTRIACDAALQDFATFHLSHRLGLLDALIAHTVLEQQLPLYTFNQKHYAAIGGLVTIQPYAKTMP